MSHAVRTCRNHVPSLGLGFPSRERRGRNLRALLTICRIPHGRDTPLRQRALIIGWRREEAEGLVAAWEPSTVILRAPQLGRISHSGCVRGCPRPGGSNSTLGRRGVPPAEPAAWPLSEARDRVQARGRDRDGVLPPGQSAQRWSRVGRGVSALPRGGLGCQPPPLQPLIEPIVRRGSCKRNRGLREQGVDGPGDSAAGALGVSRTQAGGAPEGRRACRRPAPCVLRRDQALPRRPQKSQPRDWVRVALPTPGEPSCPSREASRAGCEDRGQTLAEVTQSGTQLTV